MKISIEGKEYIVKVHHSRYDPVDPQGQRSTVVYVYDPTWSKEDAHWYGFAKCSHKDQFERLQGRRVAATRLLAAMKDDGVNKDVRVAMFRAICPEFAPKLL